MKKLLIKLAWVLFALFASAVLPNQAVFGQTHNTPYPIIFVHGLNDNNIGCWGDLDGKFDNVLDYLNGAGLQFGDNINICLNYNLSQTGVNNTKESDVHLFTPSPHTGDYYTINFNVHADGSSSAGAETTLISGALAFAADAALFVADPTIFKANDIISVDDELMQVTGYSFGSITVNRAMFGTTIAAHGPLAGVYNLSNESNQEAVAKQGYALKLAIDAIKKADPTVTKVILVGHSMGGLAIREYLRNYYNDDVAKVVTIGTPHLGSNSGEISSQINSFKNIDIKSNAIRDLAYNYDDIYQDPSPPYGDSPDDAVYLFGGGNELFLVSETNFYSWDVNADGALDTATGLNSDLLSTLPSTVSYRWIVSDWTPWGANLQGDGLVRRLRQFPWNQYDANNNPQIAAGDTVMANDFHSDEPKDYFSLLRGLDEPSSPEWAYEIGPNSTTKGFITYGTNYDPHDTDLFKINLPANGLLTVNITGNDKTGIKLVDILGVDQTVLKSTDNIYQPLTDLLQAGTYYVKIIGVPSGVSYDYPYTLAISTSAIASSLVASPNGTLNYYDELTNQARDTTITVTNNSATSLTVSGLTLSGANPDQFAISPPLGFVIQPGAAQNIAVRFLPTSTGTKDAVLNIASNSTDDPVVNVSLQGNGVAAATKKLVVTPDGSFNFGNRQVSVSAAQAFMLLDTGSTKINISSLTLIGPNANEFFLSTPGPTPLSVNPNGGSILFILNFLPTSVGSKNAQLVISNNADNKSPADTINLYGNGINSGSTAITGNIVSYEYWFDGNYASKVSVATSEQGLSALNTNFSTTGLNTGPHILNIRYKDQNNQWSSVNSQVFYKPRNIITYEYWFDSNYTGKVDMAITPAQIDSLNTNISTASLSTGQHTLNSRFKDDDGQWSAVSRQVFYKPRNIITYEYWFDSNYTGKVDMAETSSQIDSLNTSISTGSLSTGQHALNSRFKDDDGQWSAVSSQVFYKTRNIVTYEYWFDSNYAGKVDVGVTPGQTAPINTNINAASLPSGKHTFNFRSRDDDGQWSAVSSQAFYKQRNLIYYEYWFDSNYAAKVAVPLSALPTAAVNSSIPTASLAAGTHKYNVRFKDDAGQWSSVVTDTVTVLSKIAKLAGLKLSSGTLTPTFATGSTTYTASVTNTVTATTVTPTSADPTATITVNGKTVTSGTASGEIPLAVGNNTITTIVTAQDGVTKQTYTVTITRIPSTVATLSNLKLSTGTLSPAFASGTNFYNSSVTVTSMTVTPTATVAGSTITVNGKAVSSGTASGAIALSPGANTISVIVTAQDGVTKQTYTVVVGQGSNDAYLSNLTVKTATLSPAFYFKTFTYTASVANTTTSVTVTPALFDVTASSLKVNGTVVANKTASAPIALAVGPNTINITIIAQDGVTTQTYTIVITRAPSAVATLSNLQISSGTLSPVFATGTTSYNATVVTTTSSITITPTTTTTVATVTVNGKAVTSGTASGAIALTIGTNTITTVVTAQDGVTTDTYTLTVTRDAAGTNDAYLANLSIKTATLSPAFAFKTLAYTSSVPNATSSVTVTPNLFDANASVTVNGIAVANKTPSGPIALAVGANSINIVVTAEDGITTETYTVTITRATAGADSYNPGISVTNPADNPSLNEDIIFVHNGVSPNGDGINDVLVIDGILAYPDNKLSIMNRNGQLIYEVNGYDNSTKVFDGHSNKNGQMQLPGTYFYALDYTVNGIIKHKTGFIVLKY